MDYVNRLSKLKDRLVELSCDALLIEYPIDLLYLTGLELSTGKLLVSPEGTTLFVDGRYFEQCQHTSPCSVVLFDEATFISYLTSSHLIGFDSTHTTYQDVVRLEKWLSEWNNVSLQAIENPVQPLRMLKDAEEIILLREAAKLNVEGVEFVQSILKEGITEVEVAVELELFWKRRGGRKVSFDPIIAFGPNSSMPHYRAGLAKLEKDMIVLIDIGVELNHYQSDMTRVVFFGTPNSKLQEIYKIVDEAKEKAFALCRPGTMVGQLDATARDYITEKGYGSCFTHSLGHGIGLETHEPPILRNRPPHGEQVLHPGLVITIEPGIYVPGLGGVRLEDTIVITHTGYEILTKNK
jgi:Xaa-Pro aminopeptidase